jgi:hypothetical protein
MPKVKMTPKQREWAEWAIDPMEDYWEELVRDGSETHIPPLPEVEGNILKLPKNQDVIEDFLYRLEDQAQDMSYSEGDFGGARSARGLANKIRKATGIK